jgi:copper(I)-binding protein
MRTLQIFATTFAIVLLLVVQAVTAESSDLEVSRPWVSLPIMENEPAQANFSLRNNGKKTRKIVGASSAHAERIEIHRTEFVDGAETTVALKEWEVPGGGAVLFAPGGVVLVLFGPKDLKEGEKIGIELEFADGEKVAIDAIVRDP